MNFLTFKNEEKIQFGKNQFEMKLADELSSRKDKTCIY